MNKSDLMVGQKVFVYSMNRRGQEPREGEVIKIGTSLVTIQDNGWFGVVKFRIDEQNSNDKYGHEWFKTADQKAALDQREADLAFLRLNFGIKFEYNSVIADAVVRHIAKSMEGFEV